MNYSRNFAAVLIAAAFVLIAARPAPATTFTWNDGDDDWFNSSAWTPQGIPGPGDTAVINSGQAVANSPVSVAEIDLSGGITGTAPVTVTQTFNLNGGGLSGTGHLEIPSGALLQINVGLMYDSIPSVDRAVDIMGSAILSGNGTFKVGDGGSLNNLGTFDIQGDAEITGNGNGSGGLFANTGTLKKSAGESTTIDVPFDNNGTTNVASGILQLGEQLYPSDGSHAGAFIVNTGATLDFRNGTETLAATSQISGPGNVTFSGATVVDAGSYTVTGATMLTLGSVMFTKPYVSAAPLDVAGTLNFDGGFTQNSGTTTLDGGTLTSMNGINIAGGSVIGSGTLSGAVTNNGMISPGTPTQPGDVMVSGDLTEMPNGAINIRVGAPVAARGRQSATASDVVIVNGVAHLAGTLNVMIPAGTRASNLKVMSYNSHDGFFANILGVASPNRVDVGSKAVTVTSDPTGSLSAGVRMVSVPYDFSSIGQTAADLFQVSPLSDGTMPIATYDPTKPGYLFYPQLPGTQPQPGRGYWIELSAAKTITAVGNPVSSPFMQTLSPGWNMIGDPFPTAVNVSTLQFSAGVAVGSNPANTSLSFASASSGGLVNSTVYGYSGSAYVAATTLQPYQGYWIYIDPTTSQHMPVQVTFAQQ